MIAERFFQTAIAALNRLQSNASSLRASQPQNGDKLESIRKFLHRSGLTVDQIDTLPVLHVSGTKGKGSTCAFCESILRHHGYKTGFFSSPHLVEARERIRINGKPISKDVFAGYFWKIYSRLDERRTSLQDLPFYFQYIMIMALHVFVEQKVDVAIVEVGIGGEFDPTNVVTNVPVAGITSLGYDHMSVLGTTIDSIAWNKAGIMKKGAKVFTVAQPKEARDVLIKRSIERQCTLNIVDDAPYLKLPSQYPPSIRTNINLAVKLAEAWMETRSVHSNCNSLIDIDTLKTSLETVSWPGRYQIIQEKALSCYIDGAHTVESMAPCIHWFLSNASSKKKALMFNLTGGRTCEEFFVLLRQCQFDVVLFVPNVSRTSNDNADNIDFIVPNDKQIQICRTYKEKWVNMVPQTCDVSVHDSVEEAINYLHRRKEPYDLLITGSLHLVGATLGLLDPTLGGTL